MKTTHASNEQSWFKESVATDITRDNAGAARSEGAFARPVSETATSQRKIKVLKQGRNPAVRKGGKGLAARPGGRSKAMVMTKEMDVIIPKGNGVQNPEAERLKKRTVGKGRPDREHPVVPGREFRSECELFAEETRRELRRSRAATWTQAFLAVLARCGNVMLACYAADISRATAYRLRDLDAGFANAWDEALNDAADVLEKEAWRRAKEGVKQFIRANGEIVRDEEGRPMLETHYSDDLLWKLLRAQKPEKYQDGHNTRESNQPRMKVYRGIDQSRI